MSLLFWVFCNHLLSRIFNATLLEQLIYFIEHTLVIFHKLFIIFTVFYANRLFPAVRYNTTYISITVRSTHCLESRIIWPIQTPRKLSLIYNRKERITSMILNSCSRRPLSAPCFRYSLLTLRISISWFTLHGKWFRITGSIMWSI